MSDVCRCRHAEYKHYWDGPCMKCQCPEFRRLETPDTLTLRGIETE
jgi:hypothetical protein